MRDARGFTLVELLIVLAVIGLIAAIAIPGTGRSRVSANEARAIEDLRTLLAAGQKGNPSDNVGAAIKCPETPPTVVAGYTRGCTGGVYWAVPVEKGKTGVRGFAGDVSGRICFTMDGSVPSMVGTCSTIQ